MWAVLALFVRLSAIFIWTVPGCNSKYARQEFYLEILWGKERPFFDCVQHKLDVYWRIPVRCLWRLELELYRQFVFEIGTWLQNSLT